MKGHHRDIGKEVETETEIAIETETVTDIMLIVTEKERGRGIDLAVEAIAIETEKEIIAIEKPMIVRHECLGQETSLHLKQLIHRQNLLQSLDIMRKDTGKENQEDGNRSVSEKGKEIEEMNHIVQDINSYFPYSLQKL